MYFRKIITVTLLNCLIIPLLYAQEEVTNLGNVILPVSPEASSLGKYGEIPINTGTGQVNYNIPLHTIKVKDYQFSISLGYNYSGHKVDTYPSTTGLGWSLIATGVITRQVRGISFDYASSASVEDGHDSGGESYLRDNVGAASSGVSDYWPDKYTISVNGISASFFLNRNNEGFFTNNELFKVVPIDTTPPIDVGEGFVFTDDNGVEYFFDKLEISQQLWPESSTPFISSWFLSKIRLPSADEIVFSYSDSSSELKTMTKKEAEQPPYQDRCPGPMGARCPSSYSDVTTTFKTKIDTKILNQIEFPNGQIIFNNSFYPEALGSNILSTLNYIEVKRQKSIVNPSFFRDKKYVFNYNNPEFSRKVMNSIDLYDIDDEQLPFYSFEYNSPDDLESTNFETPQDKWGYASGVDENPSYSSTIKGALKTIKYPTGGETRLKYELNKAITDNLPPPSSCVDGHDTGLIFLDDGIYEFVINFAQVIDVFYYSDDHNCIPLTFIDDNNELILDMYLPECGGEQWNSCAWSFMQTGIYECQIDLPEYFKFPITGTFKSPCQSGQPRSHGSVWYTKNPANPYGTVAIGGLRVKSIEDCTSSNECTSRQFKYVREDGITPCNTIMGKYQTQEAFSFEIICGNFGLDLSCQRTYNLKKSQSPISVFNFPVLYGRVETIWNNSNGKGKVVDNYDTSIFSDDTTSLNPFLKESMRLSTGFLEKQEIYKYENSSFELIQEKEYQYNHFFPDYDESLYKRSVGFQALYRFAYGDLPLEQRYSNGWDVNQPYHYNLNLSSEKNIENGFEILTNTEYIYDDPEGKVREKIFKKSNNEFIKTTYEYPYDSDVAGSSLLFAQNIVKNPVKITKLHSSNHDGPYSKLSEVVYEHRELPNGIVVLDKVREVKGEITTSNPLETRIIYHNYDDFGNLLEVSKTGGTHIHYIWGYNHTKLVAKIENANYSDFSSRITAIQDSSDEDNDRGHDGVTENALRAELNGLRNALPNALVTTYTYDPLVGVTSITQPNGEVAYFDYDSSNRSKEIRDKQNHILIEHEYNYKTRP